MRIVRPLTCSDGRGDFVRGNVKPGRELARQGADGRAVKLGVVLVVTDAGGGRFRAVTDKGTVPFRRGARIWSRAVPKRAMTAGSP